MKSLSLRLVCVLIGAGNVGLKGSESKKAILEVGKLKLERRYFS